MSEAKGFCCEMNALGKMEGEKHEALRKKLESGIAETRELGDGYAFRLQSEMISLADLGEWVSGERKCCPFFDFEITVGRGDGPLWLTLRGSEGVKEFVRMEFGMK